MLTYAEWLALRKVVDAAFERSTGPVLDRARREAMVRASETTCEVSPEAVGAELGLLLG